MNGVFYPSTFTPPSNTCSLCTISQPQPGDKDLQNSARTSPFLFARKSHLPYNWSVSSISISLPAKQCYRTCAGGSKTHISLVRNNADNARDNSGIDERNPGRPWRPPEVLVTVRGHVYKSAQRRRKHPVRNSHPVENRRREVFVGGGIGFDVRPSRTMAGSMAISVNCRLACANHKGKSHDRSDQLS